MPARLTSAVLLVVLAGTPGALAASPSPYDSATTLTVSPRALPDRGVLSLSGFSDCAVVDGHLVFTRYDGSADNVVVRGRQATRYDDAREKYPFAIRITVPAQARPGSARVYAEPFCGPPEEYPPSGQVAIEVTRSALVLTASPPRPMAGARLRVRAATCDGPGGRITVQVALGGRTTRALAAIGTDGAAEVSVDLPPGAGTATVSAPAAARECPGSAPVARRRLTVRAAAATPTAAQSSAPVSAAPSPPSRAPVASPSTTGSGERRSAPARGKGGGPGGVGLAVAGTALVLAVGAGAVAVRRRRTG